MSIYQSTFEYYVYAYLRTDGSPYYIGKGKDDRAWKKQKWERICKPKNKNNIIICEHNLSEIGALALERRLIRWYGRKDNGTGILRNLTDGGEGGSNPGPETRKKLSESLKGRTISPETRKKISEALTGRTFSLEHRKRLKESRKKTKTTKSIRIWI